jgi:hypothetical protein
MGIGLHTTSKIAKAHGVVVRRGARRRCQDRDAEIRLRILAGETATELAKEYKVSRSRISQILELRSRQAVKADQARRVASRNVRNREIIRLREDGVETKVVCAQLGISRFVVQKVMARKDAILEALARTKADP